MPSLLQALPAEDLPFYRIIAGLWGIELTSPTPAAALLELAESVCDAELLERMFASLPPAALQSLGQLFRKNGMQPWAQFVRKNGELREVGAGKRDREKLYENPISTTEILWYRGLVSKAFFNGPGGLLEYAFIPDEIAQAMEFIGYERDPEDTNSDEAAVVNLEPTVEDVLQEILPGRLATEIECAHPLTYKTDILDDATTLLACIRSGEQAETSAVPLKELNALLSALGAIKDGQVEPEIARAFLEAARPDALRQLRAAWQHSKDFNELALVPNLILEGGWTAPVLETREFVFQQLRQVPKGKWWNLNAFIRHIKDTTPDFQRPSGDYDSWLIKNQESQAYLSGFAAWDAVEGALIRYFITGPLAWLRFVELAAADKESPALAFRIYAGMPPQISETGLISVASTGRINIPFAASRVARYQVARFCSVAKVVQDQVQYAVTTASLARAKQQGLKVDNLIALLAKYSAGAVPPTFTKALKRWDQAGSEAFFSSVTLLRFARPQTLQEFKTTSAARYIKMELNSTTVIVPTEAIKLIRKSLMELGILSEVDASVLQ